jgi:membrane protein DedA with SNARE-associated domain
MSLTGILSQALEVTSTFNPKIAIILFLLCSIGEIGFALPYILETIWLLAGYQLATGSLNAPDLLLIWLVAQAGRQTGSLVLYYTAVLGLGPLKKLYKKYIEPRMPKRQIIPQFIARGITHPSTISVAIGRLMGLRIPMALTMGASHRLLHLALGVLLSSVIWDGVYLIVGSTVGATMMPKPQYMIFYSLGGLTALYLLTLGIRFLWRKRTKKDRTTQKGQAAD